MNDIFCISCVPAEQQTKRNETEQKHKLTTNERANGKFCFLFRYSLKYVSSLAPCLATYPFAFSTIYTFQFYFHFHFISCAFSFDLFLHFISFHFVPLLMLMLFHLRFASAISSYSRRLNGYVFMCSHSTFYAELYMLLLRVCILSLMLFKCFSYGYIFIWISFLCHSLSILFFFFVFVLLIIKLNCK